MVDLKNHFKKIETQMNSLPDKLSFKIGEVGHIIGLSNHVLRYWEKEFPILKPEKFMNNQRLYYKKDIKILFLIKILLYKEKFSIEGLRKHLPSYYKQLQKIKKEDPALLFAPEQKVQKLLNSISQLRSELK